MYSSQMPRTMFAQRLWTAMLLVVLVVMPFQSVWADDQADIRDDIESVQKKIDQAAKKKATLEQNLSQINRSLSNTLSAIGQTQKALRETTDVIGRKQLEIQLLEQQADFKRELLSELMRSLYLASTDNIAGTQALLTEQSFSAMTDTDDNLSSLEGRLQGILDDIQANQDKTTQEKQALEDLKQKHEDTLEVKLDQKQDLAEAQAETAQDVAEAAATIAELQKKLKKLNSDLSGFLGADVNTNDVMKAAEIASRATGVRKAFILGELTQESGLGRFTGGCYYKNTRVKDADKKAFKQIMDELGYDVNKKKISCSPGYGYGGAMGIAQFMPTTWLGYKSRISSMTGHKPPDPWNVVDGVVGMAIKLANGGATSKSGEKNAAKVYYCGGPGSPYWKTKCEAYAKNVLRLADGYEKNN